VTTFTAASRRRLDETAHRIANLTHFVTLTYPFTLAPTSSRTVAEHRKKLLRYLGSGKLASSPIYGVWVREWHGSGVPHLHLLVHAPGLSEQALQREWARIIGAEENRHARHHAVDVRPITNVDGVISYLTKTAQKAVPEGFDPGSKNLGNGGGRFWATFGPVAWLPIRTVAGERHQIAPLLRVVRRLEQDSRRARGLPDKRRDGRHGYTCRDPKVRAVMDRYLDPLCDLNNIPCEGTPTTTGIGAEAAQREICSTTPPPQSVA
jgi:hypothetical protein